MIKHTFDNFIMPLANVVLVMGLKGVLINQQVLKDLKVQFEKERLDLAFKYRVMVAPAFNIHERWKKAVAWMEEGADPKTRRGRMTTLTALHKQFISELNPNSSQKQRVLFYEIWKLPVQKNWKTKQPTANEEALLKLVKKKEVRTQPMIKELMLLLIELRGISKKISTYCLEGGNNHEGDTSKNPDICSDYDHAGDT